MAMPKFPTFFSPDVRARIASVKKGHVLDEKQIAAEGLETFLGHFQGLCWRLTQRFSNPLQSTWCVITEEGKSSNAFAYSKFETPTRSLVIVQKGLLDRIRGYAGRSTYLLGRMLANEPGVAKFKKRWGATPTSDDAIEVFAEMLGLSCMTFLIHHEMAHVAYRHVDFYLNPTDANAYSCVDEYEALAVGTLNDAASLRVRATELDADIHSLEWSRDYFLVLLDRHRSIPLGGSNETMNQVWGQFLGDEGNLRFILLLGALVTLLALHGKQFTLADLESGSHPPTALRLLTLVHVDSLHYIRSGRRFELDAQLEALEVAMAIHAFHVKTDERFRVEKEGRTPWVVQPDDEPLQEAFADTGVLLLSQRLEDVKSVREALAADRRSIDAAIKKVQRVPSTMDVPWYAQSASPSDVPEAR